MKSDTKIIDFNKELANCSFVKTVLMLLVMFTIASYFGVAIGLREIPCTNLIFWQCFLIG